MKKAVRVVMAAAGLGILLAGCAKKEPAPETTGTTAETAEETTAEETEEVSKDIFARLSEAPEDAEAQIAVLAREVSTWAPDTEEYAGFWTGCAAADLDHNGRLEIIVSAAGGTGMFTTTRIWEVNEQKDGISEVKWEKEEGDSEPDALGSIRQTAYIDEDSELIYYIAPDYTRNGAAENYETLYALSLMEKSWCRTLQDAMRRRMHPAMSPQNSGIRKEAASARKSMRLRRMRCSEIWRRQSFH